MPTYDDLVTVPASQVLDRLSLGEHIHDLRIEGLLDLDPLVVSRWLCGEDMRGIYQPIVLHDCFVEGIDLEGRTFYEMVQLVSCHIIVPHFEQAYFYSMVTIEDCIFEGVFHGENMQSDGRVVIHNAVFANWAEFEGIDLRGRIDLRGASFLGGTNLLHVLLKEGLDRVGHSILISGCGFRTTDVPEGLDPATLGIVPLVEGDSRGAKG